MIKMKKKFLMKKLISRFLINWSQKANFFGYSPISWLKSNHENIEETIFWLLICKSIQNRIATLISIESAEIFHQIFFQLCQQWEKFKFQNIGTINSSFWIDRIGFEKKFIEKQFFFGENGLIRNFIKSLIESKHHDNFLIENKQIFFCYLNIHHQIIGFIHCMTYELNKHQVFDFGSISDTVLMLWNLWCKLF